MWLNIITCFEDYIRLKKKYKKIHICNIIITLLIHTNDMSHPIDNMNNIFNLSDMAKKLSCVYYNIDSIKVSRWHALSLRYYIVYTAIFWHNSELIVNFEPQYTIHCYLSPSARRWQNTFKQGVDILRKKNFLKDQMIRHF